MNGSTMPSDQAGILLRYFLLKKFFITAFFIVFLPNFTHAGSFSVAPLRIDLSKSESANIINLQNIESKPVTVQLYVMAWSHKNGDDHYTTTRDVIATPQVFHLRANGLQIIRVGLLKKPETNEELSYRLFIEEIPDPSVADFKGVQLALKISLPIFVAPENKSQHNLEFQTEFQSDGKLKIKLFNSGKVHAQIQKIAVFSQENGGRNIAIHEKSVYVLPKQGRYILLKTDAHDFSGSERLFIRATTRTGQVDSYASAGPP
jgi:fimbrial chaperone protein